MAANREAGFGPDVISRIEWVEKAPVSAPALSALLQRLTNCRVLLVSRQLLAPDVGYPASSSGGGDVDWPVGPVVIDFKAGFCVGCWGCTGDGLSGAWLAF